jgi:hypothetical protein
MFSKLTHLLLLPVGILYISWPDRHKGNRRNRTTIKKMIKVAGSDFIRLFSINYVTTKGKE